MFFLTCPRLGSAPKGHRDEMNKAVAVLAATLTTAKLVNYSRST